MTQDPRDRTFSDLKEGEELKPLRISVTREHINGFQEFLGHFNEEDDAGSWLVGNNLHVDEDYSRRHIYGGVVGDAHQTFQYLCQVLTDSLPWGSLVSGYSTIDVKLTNPTRPGDTVVAKGKIVQKTTEDGRDYVLCEVNATKQEDKLVAIGTIKAHVPARR